MFLLYLVKVKNLTNVHNDHFQNQIAMLVNCQVGMQIKYENIHTVTASAQSVVH